MYVQWREREHEAISELVAGDPNVMAVLMQCGLAKFPVSIYASKTEATECLG